ncbi:1-phosphatidylinositol 4,5-bisphosphate phosphodiesterase gamma-2-like isoform X2 [Xenopus laevis]|uniref:1-phosphatidylinositol 4,5-bisphosphate phosphodiesterase gamma-2-like isoform X2 n=1 Tax=Xenopus laevis TaxID=8355 RepID=A0A8J1KI15_XENLA|nr:1-phosphatidylinositol 4,5-bisphosphate phosphodiesterase gamma-2-like isoform X2 [Xenopus laevis]
MCYNCSRDHRVPGLTAAMIHYFVAFQVINITLVVSLRYFQYIISARSYVCDPAQPEISVDIREIKEIRASKNSRDFDQYQEDPTVRLEQAHCFVILYGTEFRLKTLSLQGGSGSSSTHWTGTGKTRTGTKEPRD